MQLWLDTVGELPAKPAWPWLRKISRILSSDHSFVVLDMRRQRILSRNNQRRGAPIDAYDMVVLKGTSPCSCQGCRR